MRSQAGCVVALFPAVQSESVDDIDVSITDWRSKATKRIVTSTFAAESAAASNGIGLGMFVQALLCEVYHGPVREASAWGEDVMKLEVMTDRRSLYDHMVKESSLPGDRWTAVQVAAFRGCVSAGLRRDRSKSATRWVPSWHQLADALTKKGLGDVMRALLSTGTTRLHEFFEQELRRRAAAGQAAYRSSH